MQFITKEKKYEITCSHEVLLLDKRKAIHHKETVQFNKTNSAFVGTSPKPVPKVS